RSRGAESGERTAAEREAARLERERRRQGRLAERASPAKPASPSSEADGDGADHEWDGAAVRTESRTAHADLDGYDSLAQGAEATGDSDMDDDDFADSTVEHELPSGTRRVSHHERIGSATQRPRRARRPVRRAKR